MLALTTAALSVAACFFSGSRMRTNRFLLPLVIALTGCSSVSSNYTGEITKTDTSRIVVCHGYDCNYKTKMPVSGADASRYAAIMARGRASPEAERRAVAEAVIYFEQRSAAFLGRRDTPMSQFANGRVKGEMDCIDEGTNSQSLLRYLDARGLLRHHTAGPTVSRGFILDGQFPHVGAVLQEEGGAKWVVDSWPVEVGAAPAIMPIERWRADGNLGEEFSAALG
jgi:hypothetical protein